MLPVALELANTVPCLPIASDFASGMVAHSWIEKPGGNFIFSKGKFVDCCEFEVSA